jgi:agmatinase
MSKRAPLSSPPISTFISAPFLEADADKLKAAGVGAALLGIPYDMAGIWRTGTADGPRGLRDASRQYGSYFFDDDVDLFEAFNLVDCGNVPMIPASPERCRAAMKVAASEIIRSGAMGIFIGGDHSIPIPLGHALSEAIPDKKIGYIVFDANMDAEEDVDGELYSNWSEACRLSELPNLDPRNMVMIGIRGSLNSKRQYEYVKRKGITIFGMREIIDLGIVEVMNRAIAIAKNGTEALYVSFDTDGIDAAYAPGTSGPEPGGLTSREIIIAARMLGKQGVTLFDIVELSPAYDPSGITARLACYIIFNLLGAAHSARAST